MTLARLRVSRCNNPGACDRRKYCHFQYRRRCPLQTTSVSRSRPRLCSTNVKPPNRCTLYANSLSIFANSRSASSRTGGDWNVQFWPQYHDSNDGARRVPTLAVTANYFQVLGIIPAHGRLFDSHDSTQPGRLAMLSYAAWQQQFSGDDKIVGRSITLGATTFDIVGILPAGFVFPSSLTGKPEIVTVMAPVTYSAAGGAFHPITRLEPGITREQAQAEIEALIAPMKGENPRTADLIPVLDDVKPVLYPAGRPIMAFLLVAATFVLLIGCANLAIMLLARSKRNEHEIGVRSALGASWPRLVCPLLFEACLISLAGALLAILVTAITFNALLRQVPQIAYGNAPVGVDLRVVVFALGLGLVACLAFSIVPAWRSGRLDSLVLIQGRYKHGNRQNGRLGRPMIAIQIALALTRLRRSHCQPRILVCSECAAGLHSR